MVVLASLHSEIDEILPGLIADRRYLHENPELGCEEFKTSAFVIDRLKALGVEDIRTGINVTGVTGLIRGTAAGRRIESSLCGRTWTPCRSTRRTTSTTGRRPMA